MISQVKEATYCYHCGDECGKEHIISEEKHFCCHGCKSVYDIINKVDLCEYYNLNEQPGLNRKETVRPDKFAFLDDEQVSSKLIHFKDQEQSHVTFYLPQMHCSSCIWLLEHLRRIEPAIIRSQVNFLKKEVSVVFEHHKIGLRKVAEVLNTVGYEPHISLNDLSGKKIRKYDKARIYKIGIAGFCFGNIMMLSFPEYFSFGDISEKGLKDLFSYLNLALALPVFFYSASDFFVSSWKSFRQKFLNIDAPIALAIVITFTRSVYEILSGTGAGYLDSMSGIVFFMLVGRFFQDKTYNTLTFNRDYTSYFPLGVSVVGENGEEKQLPVSELKCGMRIKVHNNEIIPADSILFLGKANIDYSFVTGESIPVEKGIGEIVYAGGKQTGGAIEMEVVKEVSQSYLTQLWNNEVFSKEKEKDEDSFIHTVSKYFTYALFSVAIASAVYWYVNDTTKVLDAVTAILIVACPCALLLSATFTNGNILNVLQRYGFYAKNALVLERIKAADTIVFDKTGTITLQKESKVSFQGTALDETTMNLVRSLAGQSSHPLSKAITSFLPVSKLLPVKNFSELPGQGISGSVRDKNLKIGSALFVTGNKHPGETGSRIYLSVDGEILGYFSVNTRYRSGLEDLVSSLSGKYNLALVSGDNEAEQPYLSKLFGNKATLQFNRKPQDKLDYIKELQSKGHKVIMIGDGLNDAGALRQSDVGIAVTDNVNNFSPACDAILSGGSFGSLNKLLNYCGKSKTIILWSFVISILYNIIGLYFASRAELEPVIAAILMPASSISILLFTTGMSSLLGLRLKSEKHELQ